MQTGLVTDKVFQLHDTGPGHPERPGRLPAVLRRIEDLDTVAIPARDATSAELSAAHDPGYLALTQRRIVRGMTELDPDTIVCGDSWLAAVRAAGAALALGEAWLEGRIETGFACVRPPGHHATRTQAMGFCLINNVAVLSRFLQAHGKRVAIVDWDVHHGNGTQDIFWDEPEIGYCSLHQAPLFPGTGAESETGAGNILNIPLPARSGGARYRTVFDERVLPWLRERAPDVVLVSAGFDAHTRDPLASMELETEDFAEFTRLLLEWPLLSVLEGGYDLVGLADSVRAHLEALIAARSGS